jgi:hypothetical protein
MRAFEAAATAVAPTLGAAGLRALADGLSVGWPEEELKSKGLLGRLTGSGGGGP